VTPAGAVHDVDALKVSVVTTDLPFGCAPAVEGGGQAASGETDTPSDVRVNVSPLAHAFDDVSATEYRKFPADAASHTLMCVRVSDVPPFVHDGAVPDWAIAPPDAADWVTATRVVSPAAAAVVPAEPGSPVCSLTKVPPTTVNVEPPERIAFSHLFATFVVLSPAVMVQSSSSVVSLAGVTYPSAVNTSS
jgi:hypothetical protein